MKLTKGKINKLYKKKRQSLKKNKNKLKNKSKRHTFRKHKKINLARRTLKNLRGGAGVGEGIQFIHKKYGIIEPVSSSYTIGDDNTLMKVGNDISVKPVIPEANSIQEAIPQAIAIEQDTQSIPVAVPESNEDIAKKVVDVLYKKMHDGDIQDSVEAVKLAANELAKIPAEVPAEEGTPPLVEGVPVEEKDKLESQGNIPGVPVEEKDKLESQGNMPVVPEEKKDNK